MNKIYLTLSVISGIVILFGVGRLIWKSYREDLDSVGEGWDDSTTDPFEEERDYSKLVTKLLQVMDEHPSRKKSVLGKKLVWYTLSSKTCKKMILDLTEVAKEVPSRQKSPMGRVLMAEGSYLLHKYGGK